MSTVTSYTSVAPGRAVLAWVELTKPRIVSLVLFTALPALLLAGGGRTPLKVLIGAMVGIALSAASAAAFNHYYDRDLDALMIRTRRRPLPAGILPPGAALALAWILAALSCLVLWVACRPLAVPIAIASIFYYAVVYTVWLKRRTPENIVIGGGAGATAPLIAWAAVTNQVGWPAVAMAAVIFLWTPPHFWALSLFRSDDYARAGLPMLPLTHGEATTRRRILIYTFCLVALTLPLAPLAGLGPLTLIACFLLGAYFVRAALTLYLHPGVPAAMRLFRYSIVYLFGLFLVMALDAILKLRRG